MKKLLTIIYIMLLIFTLTSCWKKVDNEVINVNKGKVSATNNIAGSWTVDISISSSSGDSLKAKKTWWTNVWKVDKNEWADIWF